MLDSSIISPFFSVHHLDPCPVWSLFCLNIIFTRVLSNLFSVWPSSSPVSCLISILCDHHLHPCPVWSLLCVTIIFTRVLSDLYSVWSLSSPVSCLISILCDHHFHPCPVWSLFCVTIIFTLVLSVFWCSMVYSTYADKFCLFPVLCLSHGYMLPFNLFMSLLKAFSLKRGV